MLLPSQHEIAKSGTQAFRGFVCPLVGRSKPTQVATQVHAYDYGSDEALLAATCTPDERYTTARYLK